MHETAVKPPPGGRAVRVLLHPGAWAAGAGTVVGTADGGPVVVVDGAVVVGSTDLVVRWRVARADFDPADDDGAEQPQATSNRATTAIDSARRLGLTHTHFRDRPTCGIERLQGYSSPSLPSG
jgi:hypothetical protein